MTQKTALILSVGLTAFLLVAGGAVIARVSQPEVAAAAAPAAVAAPDAASCNNYKRHLRQLVGIHR